MKNNEKNILVLGASGEIGFATYNHLLNAGFKCSGTSTNKNNSSDFINYNLFENINEKVNLKSYTHCIFCAAQTSVAKYEENPEISKMINIDRTIDAMNKAIESGLRIIFLSSADVFAGKDPFYSINQKPNPLTNYGKSKLLIENHILNNYSNSCAIIRLTKVISNTTPFIEDWKNSAKEGKGIKAFCDKYISPLDIYDLVKVIEIMITKDTFGLFQLGGKENLTYLEFCKRYFANDKHLLQLIIPTYSNSISPHASLATYLPKY